MTGSLQIKNNIYYVVLNYKDESGKRKQKWISTELEIKGNKRKAESFLTKAVAEHENMKVSYNKNVLFSDYMANWLESVKNSIEPNTYESYRDIFKRYIETYFRDKKIMLQNMEPQNIQEYYAKQLKNGLSANTVIKQHANIRKALQHAVKMNLIPYNPADRVTLPKKNEYHANFYTAEQINILLDACKNEAVYTAILLSAFYGFRRSEVLGLKWSHVNFFNNTITVQDTVVQYNTVFDKKCTKNKSSRRTLPIIPQIKTYLTELKECQDKNSILLGNGYIHNDYICKRDNGEAFEPDYLTGRFVKIIRKYNLPKIRFHDLRHSAASVLLANGFSLKEIQEWLGHSNITTTANIYGHLLFQAKQNMAASLGEKINIR
ncbi:MAG: site-specific integrase [Oscillospiraceae bacterium]|nr:site-specific integrase [Oscillospiraceae bacterium]